MILSVRSDGVNGAIIAEDRPESEQDKNRRARLHKHAGNAGARLARHEESLLPWCLQAVVRRGPGEVIQLATEPVLAAGEVVEVNSGGVVICFAGLFEDKGVHRT